MVLLITLALAILFVGACFLAIGVRIVFHSSHKFPETSAGHNQNMKKLGIMCPKIEDAKLQETTSCFTCYRNGNEADEGVED